jgi:hypothetical protein
MHHLPVHSYGKALQNVQLPHDTGTATKLETIAHYKFTLAFENSISDYYVTEKFFHPLIAGSVPIYLGAANVEEVAPADHCYIDASKFGGPRELAQYLLWLDKNPEEYATYLAWKKRGLRPEFVSMVRFLYVRGLCLLCLKLRKSAPA